MISAMNSSRRVHVAQAKLSLAQQMCHDKKLSLLKTQHMIELLHKSQAHISAIHQISRDLAEIIFAAAVAAQDAQKRAWPHPVSPPSTWQEMFFEAGSGQFDDCNAVCMHSGTMRQSLIDVTPFMPVSGAELLFEVLCV